MSNILRQAQEMAVLAQSLGCPREQIENFLSVKYFPQPKQIEFHAACRSCDEEGGPNQIGFGGARGPGKSHASFAQLALDDCRRVKGLKGLYLRKVGKQAKEQFEDLRRSVLRIGTPNEVKHDYDKRTGIVTLWDDSRIVLGHFKSEKEIDNYLGLEYDVILIEETTTLTKTKYKALRDSNRTSKNFRPRIICTTNPGNIGHRWFKARFVTPYVTGTECDTRFIPATVDDNKMMDDGYRKILEENTGWKLRAHRYGDWDIAAGQYFENFNAERHVIKPTTLREDWDYWLSMDYGFVHPTVFYLYGRDNDGTVYVIDEHSRSGWLPKTHAKAVKKMVKKWKLPESVYRRIPAGHDCWNKTEEKTIADKYKDEGLYLRPANIDRVTGAAEISNRLGSDEFNIPPSLFIFQNCPELIECLPTLQHDPKKPDDVLKQDMDEDGEGGDDPYDSLRYGLMSKPRVRPSNFSNPPRDAIDEADEYPF